MMLGTQVCNTVGHLVRGKRAVLCVQGVGLVTRGMGWMFVGWEAARKGVLCRRMAVRRRGQKNGTRRHHLLWTCRWVSSSAQALHLKAVRPWHRHRHNTVLCSEDTLSRGSSMSGVMQCCLLRGSWSCDLQIDGVNLRWVAFALQSNPKMAFILAACSALQNEPMNQ